MGTRGFFAYRYQNRYYRQFMRWDAYPAGCGWDLARSIPRDPAALEAWILSIIQKIEEEKDLRLEKKIPDNKEGRHFVDVCSSHDWMLPSLWIEWTYVFDLDNRLFIVNGLVHFKLDDMPPTDADDSGFVSYFEDELPIPSQYLATPSLWPDHPFNTDETREKYEALQSITVPLVEWGAPVWDTLSVAQHLSVHLIRVLVRDNAVELPLCHFLHIQRQLGLFCWQLTCAAASSNLICPPVDGTPIEGMLYAQATDEEIPRGYDPTVLYHVQPKGFRNRYFRFRGCLVMFCPRLDESLWMMNEIERMVTALRKNEHTNGIGIIISSWHMVAVAVDGPEVRRSPVLDLHDGKDELKEGVLLLMHLLSPVSTVSKHPWRNTQPVPFTQNTSLALPEDILRHIIHFTDHETFLHLPLVSRFVRSICLAHPRVGNYVLLSKEPGRDAIFKVRYTNSALTTLAALTRTQVTGTRHNWWRTRPFWEYRPKFYRDRALKPGLAGMFQQHQIGVGSPENVPEKINKWLEKATELAKTKRRPINLAWPSIANGEMYSELRIQALDGVWDMVEVRSEVVESQPGSEGGRARETEFGIQI